VPKADLGEKQLCPNCAAKFYDLRKRPAVCPKCATSFDPGDEVVKLKRVKAARTPTYERGYEDDEEEVAAKEPEDGEEAEVEETPELDAAEADAPVILSEDGEEEEGPANPDALPEGFSEEEADLEEAGPDAPLLELDDDEEFADDEIDLEDAGDEDEER
jgi:uncharacterized protein (TIGR02300 family)